MLELGLNGVGLIYSAKTRPNRYVFACHTNGTENILDHAGFRSAEVRRVRYEEAHIRGGQNTPGNVKNAPQSISSALLIAASKEARLERTRSTRTQQQRRGSFLRGW